MFQFSFFKTVFRVPCWSVKRIYSVTRLNYTNPTCTFSVLSNFRECVFGKYIVVFDNVNLYRAKIDDYSYIQTGSRIFNCNIGKFCSIASNVAIAPGMHEVNNVSTHPVFANRTSPLPKSFVTKNHVQTSRVVNIGHDVWVGEKAVILDGVTVGNGAVIASGAVVTKDVEAYSVVGGVPAKHIKFRFNDETRNLLLQSKWWDNSDEWFEKNVQLMLNPELFVEYYGG